MCIGYCEAYTSLKNVHGSQVSSKNLGLNKILNVHVLCKCTVCRPFQGKL